MLSMDREHRQGRRTEGLTYGDHTSPFILPVNQPRLQSIITFRNANHQLDR